MITTELILTLAIFLLYLTLRAESRKTEKKVELFLFHWERKLWKRYKKALSGIAAQARIEGKVAEKIAYRAFNMASTANLGIIALQKTLPKVRIHTKQEKEQMEAVRAEIDKLFGADEPNDWLYPVLSEEERDVLEKAVEHNKKFPNGEIKDA